MANAIYPLGKQHLLNGDINVPTANLKVVLVTSGYTYNTAHEDLADVAGIVATSPNLASKTIAAGVFDFDNAIISGLDTGETAAAYILYLDSGAAGTSWLIAYKDDAAELPLAGTTGVDVILQVNAAGFFTL